MVALHTYYADQSLVDQLTDQIADAGFCVSLEESDDTYLLLDIKRGDGRVELFSVPSAEPLEDQDYEVHILINPDHYNQQGEKLLDAIAELLKNAGCTYIKHHNEF